MARARLAAVSALVLAAALTSTGPAHAAAPANDTYPGRTVVGPLPFGELVDTTSATTDADDVALAGQCEGVPAFDASVWYEVAATSDTGLAVDVSGSSYSAGVFIATGGPGSWSLVACAPGAVAWSAAAGVAYSVVVFDDQLDGGGNGGTLVLAVDEVPPPPTIEVSVKPTASFNALTGAATVSGIVTCTGESDVAFLEVLLRQSVGRFVVQGSSGTDVTCDGATRPWSLVIAGDNGKFAGGKALSLTFALACGRFDCGVDFEERTIRLTGRR